MSYQVLARKWRPQVFEDVLGQEHITSILKNMLASGRIHHGYIFSGIRGIGKTTTARILAKALNCVHGPTPVPCNQCEFCREITEGYSIDVEEIDGASHRGVDEVRILQQDAGYAPSHSRYKIFIIDEVHSLTTPAFNALLKTLEEPPPNVIFIMATTEPWKIPPTIHSRAQHFIFKKSSTFQLRALLDKLVQHEQITISADSLALIAKSASGSIRDAENLLDQVISFGGSVVNDEDVRYVLGIPTHDLIRAFLAALIFHKTGAVFSLMEQLVSQGYNLRFFCMELMERIRNLMVLKVAHDPAPYLLLFDYSRAELDRYNAYTTPSTLQQWYWIITQAEREIKFSPNPRFILEMALAKMANVQALAPLEALKQELHQIEDAIAQAAPEQFREQSARDRQPDVLQGKTAEPPAPQPSPELLRIWEHVLSAVKEQRPALAAILRNAIPVQLTQDELTIGFHQDATISRKSLDDPKKKTFLAEVLQETLGRQIQITTTIHAGALSVETMRAKLDQHHASLPPPEIPSHSFVAETPTVKTRTQRIESTGNRKRRGKPQYLPPVEVTVQDIVKMFEGEIVRNK